MTETVSLPGDVVQWLIDNEYHHLRISDTAAYGRLYIIETDDDDVIAMGGATVDLVAGLKAHKQGLSVAP